MALSLLMATAGAGADLDSVAVDPQVEFLPHMIKILMIVSGKKGCNLCGSTSAFI